MAARLTAALARAPAAGAQAIVALTVAVSPAWAGDACIDYGEFLHLLARVDTPGFARDLVIAGDQAYVADGPAGLLVLDITTPDSPVIVGSVDTPGEAFAVAVGGGYVYVAGLEAGLHIVEISTHASPTIVGSIETPGDAHDVAIAGTMAYVADFPEGVQLIDVTTPHAPALVRRVAIPHLVLGVEVAGNFLYAVGAVPTLSTVSAWRIGEIVARSPAFQILDIANPSVPVRRGWFITPGYGRALAVSWPRVHVVGYDLYAIVDVANPDSPSLVSSVPALRSASGVGLADSHAFVGDGFDGLRIVTIREPTSPVISGSADTPGVAGHVAIMGGRAYVADGLPGIQIVDVTTPESPPVVGAVALPEPAHGVATSGSYAYVANGASGLRVLDISVPASPLVVARAWTRPTPPSTWCSPAHTPTSRRGRRVSS